MKIIINGEEKSFGSNISIEAMLAELKINPKKVAIEMNLEIIPKSLYAKTLLKDGDSLEIIEFIGGG
ncbi:MAG: sulfur carrier protein ThiS [Alphaproteobacteria bacterium]|jgi:thiamine biosynthesis protein ThiS